MSVYTTQTIPIFPFKKETLKATFYRPADSEPNAVVLYFHGGGLIFGSRNDLPESYIELFASSKIGVLAVDYPLAPETKIPALLETTFSVTNWFVDSFLPAIEVEPYFIMGRSAGGFLALKNAVYADQLTNQPLGVISLYSYFKLTDAAFSVSSHHYLKYPKVNEKLVASLIQNKPVLETTDPNRYLVYLAARQKGDWLNLFLSFPDQKRELSLDKNDIKTLPPLFLAAAIDDPDVPARQSRQLANMHPNAALHLYDLDEHDFDRTHEQTFGTDLYQKIIAWILIILHA